jgi:hypothetical protein
MSYSNKDAGRIIAYPDDRLRHIFLLMGVAIIVGFATGGAVMFLSPFVVILALVILVAAVIVVKKPELGILGFLALTSTVLESESNPGISIGFGHIYLSDILVFFPFLYIIWRLMFRLETKFVRTPLDIPLVLFILVALVSTGVAMLRGTVTLKACLGPIRDVVNYAIFFGVTNLVRSEKQLKLVLGSMIGFAIMVSIVMMAQYALGAVLPFLPGRVEVLSTEGASYSSVTRIIPPGYSIVFVGFVTACSIWFFDVTQRRSWVMALPIFITGMGVLLTFKRHFWGAFVVIFLIMLFLGNRKEIQRILIRGLSTMAVMVVATFFVLNYTGSVGPNLIKGAVDRLLSLTQSNTYEDPDSSLRWRDFENQYAMSNFVSHPLIGIGLGGRYRPWVPSRDWANFDGRAYIHSGIFWLLLRTGSLGFIFMIWLMVVYVFRGLKYFRLVPNSTYRAYMLGFTLSTLGMLMGNWVEPLISEWYWTGVTAVMMGVSELMIRTIPKTV